MNKWTQGFHEHYLPHFEEAAGIITSILQTKKSRLFINLLADTELLTRAKTFQIRSACLMLFECIKLPIMVSRMDS